MKTRNILIGLITIFTALAAGANSQIPDPDQGIVAVGGEILINIRAGVGRLSIKDRVDTIQDRLPDILGMPRLLPGDITAEPSSNDSIKMMVRGQLLVTVTQQDAAASHLSTIKVANLWLVQLRKTIPIVCAIPNPNTGSRD